jgi:TetR/AcrR family transcriptional regulator, transcriptional repressor for nem operon
MARYDRQHKEATRRRILERAGRRFKRDGIDGSGIATVMADAGLTNGAFYAHFSSKEDLVAAVVDDQLRTQREQYGAGLADRPGFEQFVRDYLSSDHRDAPDDGCPSAALLDEIVRGSAEVKRVYTEGLLAMIDRMAGFVDAPDPNDARARALSIFGAMVGTLQLSRALSDPELADEVLARGIENVLQLSGPLAQAD